MWLVLIFLLIFIGQHISYIFKPAVALITTIFFPVLVAGVLFYLTNPIVNQLTLRKVPRSLAILLIYLFFAFIIAFIVLFMGPLLQKQLFSLVDNAPRFLAQLHSQLLELQETPLFSGFQETESFNRWQNVDYATTVENMVEAIIYNFTYLVGLIANFVIVSFTIPFILFYMLKDGHKLPTSFAKFLPKKYRQDGEKMLREMSKALSNFIQGQLIVSLFVGVFVYIGYRIIGLEYALLLSVIATVTNVIPYFGPIIGTIPGMIVGLLHSPWTAVQVLIIVFIIQQLESQLVAPQVFGRKLAIHPVTIIFVLLTAGSLAGFLGLLLAIPTYAVVKVVVTHVYALIQTNLNEEKNI